MKTLKLLSAFALTATLLTSCYREDVILVDITPQLSLNQLLNSHELWYVDINETLGFGQTPFMEIAFTVAFRNGVFMPIIIWWALVHKVTDLEFRLVITMLTI